MKRSVIRDDRGTDIPGLRKAPSGLRVFRGYPSGLTVCSTGNHPTAVPEVLCGLRAFAFASGFRGAGGSR